MMRMTTVVFKKNEQGFATLIVAITLVIVLSLLTVGFAQLMRNEQNQATNRQLSNQAYYAAESGVNDALRALDAGYSGEKKSCGPLAGVDASATGAKYLTVNNVDKTPYGTPADQTPTQWTCLLIDPSPSSLEYSPVDTVTPTVFVAKAVKADGSAAAVNKVTISWKDAYKAANPGFWSASGTAGGVAPFPTAASWTAIGMVRVSITPLLTAAGSYSRANLTNRTVTAFLYPTTSSAHTSMAVNNYASPGQANQGEILDGGCSPGNTFYCSATIDFSAKPLPAGTQLLVSLRSIYGETHVSLAADPGTNLQGAQSVVDSTGRAQDVLKRVQVRVPNKSHYDLPGFTLDSIDGICKQLSVYPGYASGCGY